MLLKNVKLNTFTLLDLILNCLELLGCSETNFVFFTAEPHSILDGCPKSNRRFGLVR